MVAFLPPLEEEEDEEEDEEEEEEEEEEDGGGALAVGIDPHLAEGGNSARSTASTDAGGSSSAAATHLRRGTPVEYGQIDRFRPGQKSEGMRAIIIIHSVQK